MSIGSWNPTIAQAQSHFTIDTAALKKYIKLSREQQLEHLGEQLSMDEQQLQSRLMHQDKAAWFTVAKQFNNEELVELIRFFTVAESLSGWQAGDQSPVIWLSKVLKERGFNMSRELLLWIKANSNNRFLPYGSL